MKRFLIVLPFFRGDFELALGLVAWIKELGGAKDYPVLLMAAARVLNVEVLRLRQASEEVFGQVYSERCFGLPDETWPRGANIMFRRVGELVFQRFKMPFLWMEPDCVPLQRRAFDAISSEYEKCGQPFMGNVRTQSSNPNLPEKYLPGCSVYPENAFPLLQKHLQHIHIAFDVSTAPVTVPHAYKSELFYEWWGVKGVPPLFKAKRESGDPENVMTPRQIPSKAAFFHRCKDGALIKVLREVLGIGLNASRNSDEPENRVRKLSKPGISMIAHVDAQSGYGIYSSQVVQELLNRGYSIKMFSPSWHENFGSISEDVKSCLGPIANLSPRKFLLYPCVVQPIPFSPSDKNYAYMTMWESTRLVSKINPHLTKAISALNSCKVVMVPCSWNATVFSAQGIDAPIRVTPLGTDTSIFKPMENDVSGNLVFGSAGKTAYGGVRKGLNLVLEAFEKAFPNQKDVRLKLKMFPDDPDIDTRSDPRVEITKRYISTEELVEWYRSINIFTSGSYAEGWGKHQQESMCCGRPVMGVNFGGVTEFFNEENGYAVDWTLVPSEGYYETMGHYAKPSVESMAQQMKRAYEKREEISRKSKLACDSARRFTLENSVDQIVKVLTEFNFIE